MPRKASTAAKKPAPRGRPRKKKAPPPTEPDLTEEAAQKKPKLDTEEPIRPPDKPVTGLPEKLGDEPLRLIIVGHNPSEHAWNSGHYYSNPSNRMWTLLKSSGIAPEAVKTSSDDDLMLPYAGVGFTDVGYGFPGTDSSLFSFKLRREWSQGFLKRIKSHIDRCNTTIGCSCGECGAPRVVAFAGKTHFLAVHNATCTTPESRLKTVEVGKQPHLPEGWPWPKGIEIWVLPSTSGAAALTNKEREGPFLDLAQRLKDFPWPEKRSKACCPSK